MCACMCVCMHVCVHVCVRVWSSAEEADEQYILMSLWLHRRRRSQYPELSQYKFELKLLKSERILQNI